MAGYELIASKGCGSAMVDMALALAGLPFRLTVVPYLEDGPERDRLLALNPLGQVPTLVMPDGSVMTESAAMILHIAEAAPDARLAPAPGSPLRSRFLNELVVLVSAVYPTFTFADDPRKWTLPGEAADLLRERVDARRMEIFRQIETRVGAPFFLGESMSALDLYIVNMVRWRPGEAWFAANVPRIAAIAEATARHPVVADVLEHNFDKP